MTWGLRHSRLRSGARVSGWKGRGLAPDGDHGDPNRNPGPRSDHHCGRHALSWSPAGAPQPRGWGPQSLPGPDTVRASDGRRCMATAHHGHVAITRVSELRNQGSQGPAGALETNGLQHTAGATCHLLPRPLFLGARLTDPEHRSSDPGPGHREAGAAPTPLAERALLVPSSDALRLRDARPPAPALATDVGLISLPRGAPRALKAGVRTGSLWRQLTV